MNITVVTACWKRPEIFAYFARGIHHLQGEFAITIEVVVAGSENATSRNMVEKNGFIYVEHPNEPLAAKMNAAMARAKKTACDYVLCVGSDDIIHPSLMRMYQKYMNKGLDLIAVLDWYFYDFRSTRALYWGGYMDSRMGNPCGAGIMVGRELMDRWGWSPWHVKDSAMLDNSMVRNIQRGNMSKVSFYLREHDAYGLDIKSSTNMTPFAMWPNTEVISAKVIRNAFPYLKL